MPKSALLNGKAASSMLRAKSVSHLPSWPVVITGMHRSGTSLTASFLTMLGIRLGERLLPADSKNPLGYFEDVAFLELQARMLEAATREDDGGHRNWGWTESEFLNGASFAAFAEIARGLVADRAGRPGVWGWKDPRTTLLLDFWHDLLGGEVLYVLLYRFPWEVADSIQRLGADVFLDNPEYALRIWTFYNRRLLEFYRRHADRAVLVSTNAFQRDPGLFLELLRSKLHLTVDEAPLDSVWRSDLFVSFAPDDPLIRLTAATSPECTHLLAQLETAADLPASGLWNVSAIRGEHLRPSDPVDLSVVVPCYNHGQFLVEAIASVERAARERCELVVINDGSTQPRTLEVLDVLRQAGYRIIDQPNSGLAAARNSGIRQARGRYVLPLDADNRLAPGFVESAIEVLNAEPPTGVVYGDRLEFGARNGPLRVREFDLNALLWANFIDACAVYRREIWNACGGYDARAAVWEDWDLWIAATKRGWLFRHLPQITFEYRVRPNSMLAVAERKGLLSSVRDYVFRKHRDFYLDHLNEILIAGHAQFRDTSRDAIALLASRDRLQREIDLLANAKNAGPARNIVLLEVFHPVKEGYSQAECQARYFTESSLQFLKIELPARKKGADRPLRIDPASYPAVIDIAELTLKRPATDETLWTAQTPREFDDIEITGTASRLPHDEHLRILSFGGDPQLFLPSSTCELDDEPLRLEISLLVKPDPVAIRQCLATLNPPLSGDSLKVVIPYLALSTDEVNGAGDGISIQAPVRIGEKQVVRFENIESLCPSPARPLRIKPLHGPAFLEISRIVITRESDGRVLYAAKSAGDFGKIEVSEGAVKEVRTESFTVSAKGSEPQIFLPAVDIPADENCRLEIELEPYNPPSILPLPSGVPYAETERITARFDVAASGT